MTRITIRNQALPGEVYAAGCLADSIGTRIPIRIGTLRAGMATVVAYTVLEHALFIDITLDIELEGEHHE